MSNAHRFTVSGSSRFRLMASNLDKLDARSAHSSPYGGSTMVPSNGYHFSQVSTLRPEDSSSNVAPRARCYTQGPASRRIDDRRSTTSYRSHRQTPTSDRGGSGMRTRMTNSAYGIEERSPGDYTPYSAASGQGSGQVRSRVSSTLPYDVEERAPSDYPYFQEMRYTGDGGGQWPTTRAQNEAMYGVRARYKHSSSLRSIV